MPECVAIGLKYEPPESAAGRAPCDGGSREHRQTNFPEQSSAARQRSTARPRLVCGGLSVASVQDLFLLPGRTRVFFSPHAPHVTPEQQTWPVIGSGTQAYAASICISPGNSPVLGINP